MDNTITDVHTRHCCILHGCKYGSDDDCTVMMRRAPQQHICEVCHESGIRSLKTLESVLKNEVKTCPHCGHIIL